MRRGALLLETLLALALFVAAGGYTLLVMRDGIASAQQMERKSRAIDLAASRLAAIEAEIVPASSQEDANDEPSEDSEMRIEVSVSVSSYVGLSLVEVRVFDQLEDSADEPTVLAHLASLVPTESDQ